MVGRGCGQGQGYMKARCGGQEKEQINSVGLRLRVG